MGVPLVTRTAPLVHTFPPPTTTSHLPLNSDPRRPLVTMAARCSFLSTPVALPSVPSGIAQGPQISLLPTTIHVIERESPRNPYPVEGDLIGMDFLPQLRVTEHPIGSPPAGACPTGNYLANPVSFLEDATTNAVPPPSPAPPPPPPSSPSSHHDRIPRACHGVERRQRSRPSSRGGADYHYFSSKLTREERAALKTTSSRRVAFTEHAHQIASSSLWTSPDGAAPPSAPLLATAIGKLKRRPPTPRYATSFDVACTSFGGGIDERDESPGCDADVEIEPSEVERRGREQVGDKERLTIVVPGGKSEAYVAMAFERSCSLDAGADVDDHNKDSDCRASAVHHDMSTSEKTGLKIKIPVPNPLFMLSLRLASSCRLSDEAREKEAEAEMAAHTDDDDDGPPRFGLDRNHQNLDHLMLFRVGSTSSPSPPLPITPPSTPAPPEGRAERRVARRAALSPYCAIGRPHVARASERPCLPY